jgi:hypothetical protein
MPENVCNESVSTTGHLVSAAKASVQLSSKVLARYTGRYEFREGSRAVTAFMGTTQRVTPIDGQLYLNALSPIPQSETTFESTGGDAEFRPDSTGKVTRLVLTLAEGDAIYDRKP